MKTILRLVSNTLLVLLVVGVIAGCQGNNNTNKNSQNGAQETEDIQRNEEIKKIRVGTTGEQAPVSYVNEEGNLTGYDIELLRKIGEYLKVEVEFHPMKGDAILPSLRNNQIDIAANDFTSNPEREQEFNLTDPYKFSYGSIIVRNENDDLFNSALDLAGHEIGVVSLTGNYTLFAEAVGAIPTLYEGGPDAVLRDVQNEQVIGWVNDHLVLQRALDDYNYSEGLMIDQDVKFDSSSSVFIALKDEQEIVELINEALEVLRADGTMAELAEEFYGEDISHPIDTSDIVEFEDLE